MSGRFNPKNPEIDTRLYNQYLRFGVPNRIPRVSPFGLKNVLQDAILPGDKVLTRNKQVEHYLMALREDPGWFFIIQTPTLLDYAKHIAVNVLHSYVNDSMSVCWLTSFFKDPPGDHNLYVFDSLFEDDIASRRSRVYEILCGLNSPTASVILLSRSTDLTNSVRQIGLKPHLMLSLTR